VSTTNKPPVFVVGSARSGNTMLYQMLRASGRFPVYRTEPCVFDVLVPKFGDFRSVATRRKLMRCWLRTRQFRRSNLDAGAITEKVVSSVSNGGEFLRAVMEEVARAGNSTGGVGRKVSGGTWLPIISPGEFDARPQATGHASDVSRLLSIEGMAQDSDSAGTLRQYGSLAP